MTIHYSKKLYNGDEKLPVYRWKEAKEHYSLDTLANVLLNDSVPLSCICSKQPVHVCHNVTFVVVFEKLGDPTDVRADKYGVWIWKWSPVAYVSKHTK